MNPLIWKAVDEIFRGGDRIHLTETFDVIDFHNFIAHSYMIFTDSEGIQEETSSLA
jgi:UDP-N-acetylglucosamine 2-epimerase (non-hydrolysing)